MTDESPGKKRKGSGTPPPPVETTKDQQQHNKSGPINLFTSLLKTPAACYGVECCYCFEPINKDKSNLVACAACERAHYCNKKTCQQNDLERHQPECQLLRFFRENTPVPPQQDQPKEQQGVVALQQRIIQMSRIVQNLTKYDSKENNRRNTVVDVHLASLITLLQGIMNQPNIYRGDLSSVTSSPALLQEQINSDWEHAMRYIQYSKVCCHCGKTEYDFKAKNIYNNSAKAMSSLEEQQQQEASWTNCGRCNFGWCCCPEHFNEYKKSGRHTSKICTNFSNAATFHRYSSQHIKKHNRRSILYVPDNPVLKSQPLTSLPTNWHEYYKLRDPELHELIKDGTLSTAFALAATRQLSQPLTILNAMFQLGSSNAFLHTQKLTIHVIGDSSNDALHPTDVYEELLHCLPFLLELTVVFIGPKANQNDDAPTIQEHAAKCCNYCSHENRKRKYIQVAMAYHEYYHVNRAQNLAAGFNMSSFIPDLVVAYNSGMYENSDRWTETIKVLLDLRVPCLFTSYNLREAQVEYEIMTKSHNANTSQPVQNPYAAHPMEFNPFEVHTSHLIPNGPKEDDGFFSQPNMYYITFQGKQTA